MPTVLSSGNAAIARGAYEAGVSFASGYPGTPSSEILEALADLTDIPVEWAPNEKTALEAAVGASLAGARALATMKHVGLNVAADPLFTCAYTGVEGGLVIVTADDPGMASSQNEQDNRHYAFAAKIPMLEPSDSQEALEFTQRAFEISEQYDIPVLLRTTTRISHSKTVIEPGEVSAPQPGHEPAQNPAKYVMIPAHARRRHRDLLDRLARLTELSNSEEFNRIEPGEASLGIITSGIAYQYAREAAPQASFLKIGMPFPFPAEVVSRFAAGVERLVVFEEVDRVLETQIRALGIACDARPGSMLLGELSSQAAAQVIDGSETPALSAPEVPPRPPVMCAGCPHRPVFHILKKLKCYATGDIGCYTLGTLPPLEQLHTCLCMGAGIGQAHGISQVYDGERPIVAVIGDSTFIHSGITGLVNMVYNQSAATVVILDNRTTAMTGGQFHPATGKNLRGQTAPELDLAALCRAVGVQRVQVVESYDVARLEEILRAEIEADEISVVIARQPCVLLRGRVAEHIELDAEVCVACGLCLQIGCPALVAAPAEEGEGDRRRPLVQPALCNGCGVCAQICPRDALKLV